MNINDAKSFKSIILLNELIVNGRIFKTIMNGDDRLLEPLFIELLAKNYIAISGDRYVVTNAGQLVFDTFMGRYKEYLKIYDIYAFVDTAEGEFAFEKFYDFNSDEKWNNYKSDERFFDVRIAVATFKKINPFEIVFMSFINENRFDTTVTGWQFDLLADNVWAEIDEIVRTSITAEELGDIVLENMIKRGTEVMMMLIQKELEINKKRLEDAKAEQLCMADDDEGHEQTEEYIVETTTIIEEYEEDYDYYAVYYDPWYISPIWLAPLFIW
jgi:hypothetical protein